jgi:5-methylcytosine-specific restriction endonuclease McrA
MADPSISPSREKSYRRTHYQKHRDEILAKQRAYRARKHEQFLELWASYRDKNRLRLREGKAEWERKHPEKKKEHGKTYYWRHREKLLQKAREYRRANYAQRKEKEAAKLLAWRQANPDKAREQVQRRRARKAQAPVNDFTPAQWRALCKAVGYRCCYCGKKFPALELTRDHLTPVGPQGGHTLQNILPCCLSCNSRKNDRAVLKPVQPFLLLDESAAD